MLRLAAAQLADLALAAMKINAVEVEREPPSRTKSGRIWCGFWCGGRVASNEDEVSRLWGRFENDSANPLIVLDHVF